MCSKFYFENSFQPSFYNSFCGIIWVRSLSISFIVDIPIRGWGESASLKALVIQDKAVSIPSQQLYALSVLREKDVHVSCHRAIGCPAYYQIEQGVYALAHAHRFPPHEVPMIAFQSEHITSRVFGVTEDIHPDISG